VALKSLWVNSSAALVVNGSNIDVATAVLLLKLYPGFAPIAVESYTNKHSWQSLQLRKSEEPVKKKKPKGKRQYRSLSVRLAAILSS
jgi:hypothetical protein